MKALKTLKNKEALLNVASNLVLQACHIVSGFIVPRIILSYFGSDVNGLISSIAQFLSYITLIEGGLTGVITASLYKPLCEGNDRKVSAVINAAKRFFRWVGVIYIVYALIIAIVYPIVSDADFSFVYVFALTLILAFTNVIQYMYSLVMQLLLKADKKVYIVSCVQILVTILNIIAVVVSVQIFPSAHVVKLLSGLLFILQPVVYSRYIKKHYNIDREISGDKEVIKNRWNGFAINIAAFVHNCTDVSILTFFTDLATVSVYAVYTLVTSSLKKVIMAVTGGLKPSIAQLYAKEDYPKLRRRLETYEYVIFVLVFFLFSLAGLLITPFVMFYTEGVTDAAYFQPLFGVLIVISEALYLIKIPHLDLAYSANKFKDITIPAFIEAGLNIVISIALVNWLGIIGVAIGTIIAMAYRAVFHVYYTKKIVPQWKQRSFYKKLVVFSLATVVCVFVCLYFFPIVEYNVLNWITHGIVYAVIFAIGYGVLSVLFFRNDLKDLKGYIKK